MTEALVALLVLLPVIVWWQMATRAREQAAEYVHRACQDADVQWLDSTVIFHRWEWAKDSRAKRYLRRTYLFEYCDDGISRRQGFVAMRGMELEWVGLGPTLVGNHS